MITTRSNKRTYIDRTMMKHKFIQNNRNDAEKLSTLHF